MEMSDACRLDDTQYLEADGLGPPEERHSAPENHRHEIKLEFIEETRGKSGANDFAAHEHHRATFAAAGSGTARLLDRARDALGDEGVGDVCAGHFRGSPMGEDDEGNALQRALATPTVCDVIGAPPADDGCGPVNALIEDLRADRRQVEAPAAVAAGGVALEVPVKQSLAALAERLTAPVLRSGYEAVERHRHRRAHSIGCGARAALHIGDARALQGGHAATPVR